MNRLWVRISLVFGGMLLFVILLVILIPAIFRVLGMPAGQFDSFPELQQLPPETLSRMRDALLTQAFAGITLFVVVGAVAALLAGAWLSRSLTAPLRNLEEAAEAIEDQELSHRVPIEGSRELRAVATAFNSMAAQLEEGERLRRNLFADVAHELRNPLHVLQGNLGAILDDVYPLNKEEIARLSDQTRHLTALVDDLHELALAEAHQLPLERAITDMAALVKESAAAYRPVAVARGVDLRVELLGTIPALRIDAARIRQAIQNLLDNALRHSPEGGLIKVSVERRQDELLISVQDNGSGIEPQHLDHVFDRFYRTDSARSRETGGMGLGLAIVRAIVEEHGGRVTVTSPGLDQGSTLTICLPA